MNKLVITAHVYGPRDQLTWIGQIGGKAVTLWLESPGKVVDAVLACGMMFDKIEFIHDFSPASAPEMAG